MPPKFNMSKCAQPTKRGLEDAGGPAQKIPKVGFMLRDPPVRERAALSKYARHP